MPDKTQNKNKNTGVEYQYLPSGKAEETQNKEVDPNISSVQLSDLMSKLKNL